MEKEKLQEILSKHLKWFKNEDGGERANLVDANLVDADLRNADLRGADLIGLKDADKIQDVLISQHDVTTKYKAGEIVRPDAWDDNRWDECSNGIHFFITKLEAENY